MLPMSPLALPTHHHLLALGVAGYAVITALVFGESIVLVGFFIPGSLITIVAGGLAAQGMYNVVLLWILVSLGAVAGNTVSFELGWRGEEYLKTKPRVWKHVKKGQLFFKKYGGISVFIGHFLGPLRHVVPAAAGLEAMKRKPFQIANVTSSCIWAATHLGAGYLFGKHWKEAIVWSARVGVLGAAIAFLALLLWWGWKSTRTRKP